MTMTANPSFAGLHNDYQMRVAELGRPADKPTLARRLSRMGAVAGQLALTGDDSDPKTAPATWTTVATWLHALAAALEGEVPTFAPFVTNKTVDAWSTLATATTPVAWSAAWADILPELTDTDGDDAAETAALHILHIAASIMSGGW